MHNTTEDQSLLPSNKCIFPEVKLNFNATYPVKLSCQASKVLICCLPSVGFWECCSLCCFTCTLACWTPHTPSTHPRNAPGKIQREIWHSLKSIQVRGTVRHQGGRKEGCFWVQKFLPCSLTREDLYIFGVLLASTFGNEQILFQCSSCTLRAPFVTTAFVKKWGVDWHGMTFFQRETNLHGRDKRALKTSPCSYEPERGEKEEFREPWEHIKVH